MADLLKDIAGYLTDQGVVEGEAVDTFCDYVPDDPDKIIVLQEYQGPGTSTGAVTRNIQLTVRTTKEDPDWARTKIWEIFNVLDTPGDRVIDLRETDYDGTLWGVLISKGTPYKMGTDPIGRVKYVFNFGIVSYRD